MGFINIFVLRFRHKVYILSAFTNFVKMAFKINVSNKGKTYKVELESEDLLELKIGDKIQGSDISPDLEGYELEITGTSDASGFPGIKGQQGDQLRGLLLTKKDTGMNSKKNGLRLRKTVRGEEISEKTVQININVLKEGPKAFDSLFESSKSQEAPAEGSEKPAEAPAEEEPKATEAEKAETSAPDEEPKPSEAEKTESANPDEEPKA